MPLAADSGEKGTTPFALASRHARGVVLRTAIESPAGSGRLHPEMRYLVANATHDEASGRTAIFALNRHLSEAQELTVRLRGFAGPSELVVAQELFHTDLQATNTREAPPAWRRAVGFACGSPHPTDFGSVAAGVPVSNACSGRSPLG